VDPAGYCQLSLANSQQSRGQSAYLISTGKRFMTKAVEILFASPGFSATSSPKAD